MELLFWIDAFKRASAASVTAIMPYFSYAKGDKKDEPRVSIRARVCADAIEAAGVDRVVTMDLHAPQIQGFFRMPVDDLYGRPSLCDRVRSVVAPATWWSSRRTRASPSKARLYADYLGGLAGHRRQGAASTTTSRPRSTTSSATWQGRDGRHRRRLHHLRRHAGRGGLEARAAGRPRHLRAVTHGVFAHGSMERIDRSPIRRLFVTDTVENQPVQLSAKDRGRIGGAAALARRSGGSTGARASAKCSRSRGSRGRRQALHPVLRPGLHGQGPLSRAAVLAAAAGARSC